MNERQPPAIDLEDDASVSTLDELGLWAAPFGLRLLDALALGRGLHVLDVGFGTGFPLLELAARLGESCEVHGLDPWPGAHRRAGLKLERTGLRNVQLHRGRAEQMPFPDGSFDRVVSNNGYNNVADMGRAFRETARVCRVGAQLVFTMNLDGSFREFHDVFRAVLEEQGLPAAVSGLSDFVRGRRPPLGEVLSLVRGAGFTIERADHDQFAYRFSDAAALLNHPFFRWFQAPHWRDLLPPDRSDAVFAETARRLDGQADALGEIRLSVPFVVISARRATA